MLQKEDGIKRSSSAQSLASSDTGGPLDRSATPPPGMQYRGQVSDHLYPNLFHLLSPLPPSIPPWVCASLLCMLFLFYRHVLGCGMNARPSRPGNFALSCLLQCLLVPLSDILPAFHHLPFAVNHVAQSLANIQSINKAYSGMAASWKQCCA